MANPDKKNNEKAPVDKDAEKKLADAKLEADKKQKGTKKYSSSGGGVQGDGSAGLSGTSGI